MEPVLQGNLSDTPASTVLERISRNGLEGILHLRFWDSDLNTKMIVAGDRLGGIVGPFVPSWSASLVPSVVNGEHYERIRAQTMNASQALMALMQQGVVEMARWSGVDEARQHGVTAAHQSAGRSGSVT
ncbi:MAG: hypothetical protein HC933_02005, partial [Pleurocapsa sp. SU_196_0]|nr:hypothetical protein [Pleurocapsa sp. SU_196_0]